MKNNYNERSWAIDVISEINRISGAQKKTIKRAGGERTLKDSTKGNALFPDVLLFQDETGSRVLQGWELKMPDTPITDEKNIKNAALKAEMLGLNSFLVWNVSEAALYIIEDGKFSLKKQWSDLKNIKNREDVEPNKAKWIALLQTILNDLEEFFRKGEIKSQSILDSLSEHNIVDVITGNIGLVKQNLIKANKKDSRLAAEIKLWWDEVKIEYSSEPDEFSAVSKLVLITWVNRFLFTHYLKSFTVKAFEIDNFNEATTIGEAKVYFQELTKENDFLNVFAPVIGEDFVDEYSWEQILQLNSFLADIKLQNFDQNLLQQFFEKLLLTSKRKAAGQYATPYNLAAYLARIVINDKTLVTMDAFCGTGTILRACYDTKISYGVTPQDAIESLWGSDKFSFPLHMTTLSLARPEVIGKVINVFKSDVKDLKIGNTYEFTDPNTGRAVRKSLPKVDYFICNLPFVEAAKIKVANPDIFNIKDRISSILGDSNFEIPGKSDLIAYLPYYLWDLLNDNGRIGLIISNSWLGTDWGEDFRRTLQRFFKIDLVVTSGNGKWFSNADVVTNLVVLTKRNKPVLKAEPTEETSFVTMKIPIDKLTDRDILDLTASQTLLKRNGNVKIQTLSVKRMADLNAHGLNWSSYFADLSWFDKVGKELITANTLFDINRGERRGWDDMFFPGNGNKIEAKYLKPVLMNFRQVKKLIASPQSIAFCCSETLEKLKKNGDHGALSWISRFEKVRNGVNKLLPDVLARANHHWYEMKDNTVADLVGTINYGETLFIAKMEQRSFVNQRLIRFTSTKNDLDIDLIHALMNSYIGIFYIEALGFGRGMGALDLSSTKVRDNLYLLNAENLTSQEKIDIKTAFAALCSREINKVPAEVELNDRKHFEQTVAKAYGLEKEWDKIKESLLDLHNIRMCVSK
ncbi:N-6 DNA methylase [Pontibacter vulgaris]|uniref:N-6 DNA methylase n=1 Tax=Pontibacter vulgaris TaxID=2905679 RepID=UPI001FA6D15E